jgi:hypothetical protein
MALPPTRRVHEPGTAEVRQQERPGQPVAQKIAAAAIPRHRNAAKHMMFGVHAGASDQRDGTLVGAAPARPMLPSR